MAEGRCNICGSTDHFSKGRLQRTVKWKDRKGKNRDKKKDFAKLQILLDKYLKHLYILLRE
jgi:hypothetical protein